MAGPRLTPRVEDIGDKARQEGTMNPLLNAQETISIRRAGDADRAALLLLAVLDSGPPLAGDVLIAHVDGEPRAALELDGGATLADPFRPTAHVLELLRLRADGLRREHVVGGGRRLGRRRRRL